MTPKKVVFDTNVLVRTTFKKRSPVSLRIYQAIEAQECITVITPAILKEIKEVINRDYIIKYTHTTAEMREEFIKSLIDISMLTPGTGKLKEKSRDSKDDKFLICAIEAKADYIVTSDNDLLVLKNCQQTQIMSPEEFVKQL